MTVLAVSSSKPTRSLSFPNHDLANQVVYQCNDEHWESVHVHFSSTPNITNDETKDGYNISRSRVKWDDRDPITIELTQRWGSRNLVPDNPSPRSVMRSSTLLMEFEIYGQGKVAFKYDLAGSTKAINEARRVCGITGES